MQDSTRSVFTVTALAALVLLLSPSPKLAYAAVAAESALSEDLGSLDFPNSGSPNAQEAFRRGVLLLHSFEFDDAAEAFAEARAIDPDFALAYWGEAMTHNHPLWRYQKREAALAVLDLYAPTPDARAAKAPTERERAYLDAIEVLYGTRDEVSSDKVDRDHAYSEAMERLSKRYPEDLEAKAFYALSILGTTQGTRDFRVYMRAGAVAEEVFAASPRHPGAAHYLIHSYDDPVHAPLGLRAARVYADIAPAASHAQHMISHIFVALGRWEDSVQSNINAYEVSKKRRETKGLPVEALNFHALQWLQYSYLQLGLLDDARDILDRMAGFADESSSERTTGYYATMRAMFGAEAPDRDLPPFDALRAGSDHAVKTHFVHGLRALRAPGSGAAGAAAAAEDLAEIRGHLEVQRLGLEDDEGSANGSGAHLALEKATVLERSLAALVALEAGEEAEALAFLDEATEIEAGLPLEFGPPEIVKPSHELYGEVLLGLGKSAQAERMFEAALDRAPRRTASLLGLARAAGRAQNRDARAEACLELAAITARGAWDAPAREACGSETS